MSLPNLAGIVIYMMVVFLCLLAAIASLVAARPARHTGSWLACSAAFGLLIALRLLMVEERVQAALRLASRKAGEYGVRHELQIPLVAVTLFATVILLLLAVRRLRRRHAGPRNRIVLAALFTTACYVPLHAVRIISWHETDRILYHGAFHLNWVIDFGLALIVGGLAVAYMMGSRTSVSRGRVRNGRR